MIFLSPLIQSLGSGNWPQADCEILKSKVKINSDSDGNSYKPIVEYKYNVDGVKYHGDSPTFEDISASQKWAQGIINKYKVGSTVKCFYDPEHPGTSVLDPTFPWSFYAMSLLPLVFVAIGAALFGSALFGWGSGKSKPPETVSGHLGKPVSSFTHSSPRKNLGNGLHQADLKDQQWAVPKRLLPTHGRWVGLLFIALFAGFWNTFIGYYLWNEAHDWFADLSRTTPWIFIVAIP